MKFIRFVPTQTIRNPVSDVEVGKMEQSEALLMLTQTPEFVNELKGIEATELLTSARKSVRKQKGSAETRGCYELEDAHAKAFKNAAEKFAPNPSIAEAVHPYLEAIVGQTSEPVTARSESNGASAELSS